MSVKAIEDNAYRIAMGKLLVMYTQFDYLIMRACAERIATAPSDEIRLFLAKQVGDESQHVRIQQKWIEEFGTDPSPVISEAQEMMFLIHFRSLDWIDFLIDMYVCVEALGSEAVEQIVPLADPGSRESLKIPLEDEVDHVRFGLDQLKFELGKMPMDERQRVIDSISGRLDYLDDSMHDLGLNIPALFEAVGADYQAVVDTVMARRAEIMDSFRLAAAA